jgi:hypothetical protein
MGAVLNGGDQTKYTNTVFVNTVFVGRLDLRHSDGEINETNCIGRVADSGSGAARGMPQETQCD